MRDSIMMYRTQCDAIRELPPEQFKAVVTALWDYEMDGIIPEGDPLVVAMWRMAQPLIDKRNRAYENGKKGGRPKTEVKPDGNPIETQQKPDGNPIKPNSNLKDKGKRLKDKDIDIKPPEYPYKEVIDYLNLKTGANFKSTSETSRKHMRARFEEGFTLEDFKRVIDGRCAAWQGDPKMGEYLRPVTLFGTKFESYLNAHPAPRQKNGNRFNNFSGRTYDYDELERKLTGVM